MKLTKHDNNFKSNVNDSESHNFGIGDASVVIDILRNRLYKNKIQTLVQEYICNGRDAMREADSKGTMLIAAPTRVNPVFKVRDYGLGITPARMASVFVNYGSSTKRANNKQTGGFGIGAKSAWAYTDSFTIITFVDGIKRTYVAHTGVNNNGRLDLLNTETTSEANGTEINIAVKQDNIFEFRDAIERAVYFWDNSTMFKVLNCEISRHRKGEIFGKHLEMTQNNMPSSICSKYSQDLICTIDSIPYNLKALVDRIESLKKINNIVKDTMILHLPNGLLEVSASREEISDSEHTIKHLNRVCDAIYKEIDAEIKKQFSTVKNVAEFVKTHENSLSRFNLSQHKTYGHYSLDNKNNITTDLLKNVTFYRVSQLRSKNGVKLFKTKYIKEKRNTPLYININEINSIYHDNGDSAVVLGQRFRNNLSKDGQTVIYIENNGDAASYKTLIKELNIKPVNNLALPVTPTKTPKQKRESRSFCMHLYKRNNKYTEHTTLDKITEVYYYFDISETITNPTYVSDFLKLNLCGLSKTSIDMVKGNKNFKSLDTFLNNYVPTNETLNIYKRSVAKNLSKYDTLKNLVGINNKKMLEFIKDYEQIKASNGHMLVDYLSHKVQVKIKQHPDSLQFIAKDIEYSELFKEFGLIDCISGYNVKNNADDMVLYINEKTKKLKRGSK